MIISRQVKEGLARLSIYQDRVKEDLARGDYAQAMADVSELAEISRRLWEQFQKETARIAGNQ
jgi:hypothetical protein